MTTTPSWHPSAWWLLAGAVPILLLGDILLATIKPLARFDLPAPIVGGLLVALLVLLINLSHRADVQLGNKVSSPLWSWIITPSIGLQRSQPTPIYLPISTGFFCCVGLNASWSVAKKGSWQLLLLLGLATLLGVLQNVLGVSIARGMNQSPLLGLICGSVTLTGGPSTALGFADTFAKAGFAAADVVGAAAAMFGIVAASILAGAFGGQLIRRFALRSASGEPAAVKIRNQKLGFIARLNAVVTLGPTAIKHLLIVLICIKLGAWLSLGISALHIPLPVYMGAMLVAVAVRNICDTTGKPRIETNAVQAIASLCLALFLATAMASLDLLKLKTLALPMLVILGSQIVLMILFALLVTYVVMGRDYDAAVMAAGHVGFGLGITPNAVATMDVLEQKFGAAPRAVLIVTVVGAFLIDFTNSLIITLHLNWLQR
jgi:ESS family glutamate:Na+ symporter